MFDYVLPQSHVIFFSTDIGSNSCSPKKYLQIHDQQLAGAKFGFLTAAPKMSRVRQPVTRPLPFRQAQASSEPISTHTTFHGRRANLPRRLSTGRIRFVNQVHAHKCQAVRLTLSPLVPPSGLSSASYSSVKIFYSPLSELHRLKFVDSAKAVVSSVGASPSFGVTALPACDAEIVKVAEASMARATAVRATVVRAGRAARKKRIDFSPCLPGSPSKRYPITPWPVAASPALSAKVVTPAFSTAPLSPTLPPAPGSVGGSGDKSIYTGTGTGPVPSPVQPRRGVLRARMTRAMREKVWPAVLRRRGVVVEEDGEHWRELGHGRAASATGTVVVTSRVADTAHTNSGDANANTSDSKAGTIAAATSTDIGVPQSSPVSISTDFAKLALDQG